MSRPCRASAAVTGLLGLAALALAPGAAAGTAAAVKASGTALTDAVYTAAPGEQNRLAITFEGFFVTTPAGGMSAPGTVVFRDPAGVSAGPGCSQAGPTTARCPFDGPGQPSLLVARALLGEGNDTAVVRGNDRSTELFGGPGNDVLNGGDLFATLSGDAGNDTIQTGNDGTTRILAGAAADGADVYKGGTGFDTLTYGRRSAPVAVSLDSAANDGAPGESDSIDAGIDRVIGGAGDDRMTGDGHANDLYGGGGKDLISGGGGGDVLHAGRGTDADRLDGGRGDDELDGNAGPNRLDGGPGLDDLRGRGGDDRMLARDGDADAVLCDAGRDRAKLDKLDFIAKGCERHTRRRGMAATLLQHDSQVDDDSAIAAFRIGCPADGPRRCTGHFDVFRGGKLRSRQSFSLRRGRLGAAITDPNENQHVIGDVKLRLVTRDRRGRIVVRRARGHIDEPVFP